MFKETNRRSFVKGAGALAIGSVLMPGCKNQEVKEVVEEKSVLQPPSLDKYGIQLYSVRDDIPKDPKEVLKKLASYGYNQIEGYEGDQGMFWDMTPKDFKSYINDLGMELMSSHCNINENFESKAEQAAEAGMEYLICPYVGPQKTMEAWQEIANKFNECGEICRKNGLKFAYHNHGYSFTSFESIYPHDFLMKETDPELVLYEMDIYWVITAGADPVEYLEKYPGRFTLCHIKDRMKNAGDERQASCNLGTGIIDFPTILKRAKERGMEYFIMEQERYDDSTPLESAEIGANYLKKLRFA